ncbi:hypothetical protein I4U23_023979 [Adineta vaga]|nr:hypothetical protein I4U23_023979 [Adineta vaga]
MDARFSNELQQLQMELRAQNFDLIRFSTYRTACKLRFIQKKLNFHLLDLLNVMESLRESLKTLSLDSYSMNATPTMKCRTPTSTQSFLPNSDKYLSIKHLTLFLTSIYTNLNKRLPLSQQIHHIDNCVHSAIAWFLYVYNPDEFFLNFNSFRVVLILLCAGKLVDKLRHLFTSCFSTSSSNNLTYEQIDALLHEMLALPYALQEISHSTYYTNYAQSIFSHSASSITLDECLQMLIYQNKTPSCLQWLIIFHRLISVENVIHRVKCSVCQRPSFSGFRYKCQECHHRNYQLCQDCFWRGRTSEQHLSTHEMKEYTYFISPNKDFRQSIRKSFKCMPKNERHHQCSSSLKIDKEQESTEHNDISSYSKDLMSIANNSKFNSLERKFFPDENHTQQKYTDHRSAEKKLLISKLEAENRRILHEIKTLRAQLKYRSLDYVQTDHHDGSGFSTIEQQYSRTLPHKNSDDYYHSMRRAGSVETTKRRNRYFEVELDALLTHKYQLESRIDHLRQSQEELSTQLDNLGRILHSSPHSRQRSTTSSPHNHSCISPSHLNSKKVTYRSYSTPSTPIHHQFMNHLRTDLLLAADSLTSALSTLVQHLNTKGTDSYSTTIQPDTDLDYYSYENDDYLLKRIDDGERLLYSTSVDETV